MRELTRCEPTGVPAATPDSPATGARSRNSSPVFAGSFTRAGSVRPSPTWMLTTSPASSMSAESGKSTSARWAGRWSDRWCRPGAMGAASDVAISNNRLRLETARLNRHRSDEMRRVLVAVKDVDVQAIQDAEPPTGDMSTGHPCPNAQHVRLRHRGRCRVHRASPRPIATPEKRPPVAEVAFAISRRKGLCRRALRARAWRRHLGRPVPRPLLRPQRRLFGAATTRAVCQQTPPCAAAEAHDTGRPPATSPQTVAYTWAVQEHVQVACQGLVAKPV